MKYKIKGRGTVFYFLFTGQYLHYQNMKHDRKRGRLIRKRQKSVSKTRLNAYSICRRHIYKRKPLSKTKHIAYNIKGHLSACKRRSFRRQKVAFWNAKDHLSSYIYLSAGQLCLCNDIRTRHKPTVRTPTLTQYIRPVCAIRDIIIAHGSAGGVSTDNSP